MRGNTQPVEQAPKRVAGQKNLKVRPFGAGTIKELRPY